MDCSMPGFLSSYVLHCLPGFAQILCPLSWWCHPAISSFVALFSFCLQSFPASGTFSSESALHIRWPKYWSFSINLSNEYSGLISFRIGWLDLLAVQGILKSLLQHNSKASILWCSAFFMVQLSHSYITTGKTIALTIWAFVGKVMSLLFNMLSRFVIDKGLLLSTKEQVSFHFIAAVNICSDFGAQENEICHCFHFFTIFLLLKAYHKMETKSPLTDWWIKKCEIYLCIYIMEYYSGLDIIYIAYT